MSGSKEMTLSMYEILLAYQGGIFPMAESRDDPDIFWVDPTLRGQLPLLDLHIPKRLERTVRAGVHRVTVNTAFDQIIDMCAETARGRDGTWINRAIRDAYCALNKAGYAHSVEVWEDETLVGGLYGVAVGAVFCGESMVSRARDASKIALVHLSARLYAGSFHVLDTQFINDHLKQFGAYEIPQARYRALLSQYAGEEADFSQTGRSEQDLVSAYFAARAGRGRL